MESPVIHTASSLVEGAVYTRNELSEAFQITAAGIRNGHFHPKWHDSVWLFLTEEKEPDRTQYVDRLQGVDLVTDGQTKRKTDHLIIDHRALGLDLLVFYRKSKHQYPHYGFRFVGEFEYVSHETRESVPTRFHLRRVARAATAAGR